MLITVCQVLTAELKSLIEQIDSDYLGRKIAIQFHPITFPIAIDTKICIDLFKYKHKLVNKEARPKMTVNINVFV